MSQHNYSPIDELDLEPIKVKLMHEESGEGWSLEHADAVEKEYRRFLHLMKKYPQEPAAPLMDVDTFWHYHILDTMKYAVDCEAVFGHFLHHFPYIGLRGEEDEEAHHAMGERMKELYEETFGEDYIRASTTAWSARAPERQATAWSARAPEGMAAQTAWSARAPEGMAANTAWSARAPEAMVAKTVWSARAPEGMAAQTAWSARAPEGLAAQTAWSARAPEATAAKTAWSARAPEGQPAKAPAVAWSARSTVDQLYTARPRLTQSTA